nr:MAG TPA: hypothetical protein [Bacteriophage sp.]DAM70206.1 MAG TPA: hypothetical protein [Caudoviricetes sp.]DAO67063.1 MAG TPA: hypothetical protein [Caudoviricetes sp.]
MGIPVTFSRNSLVFIPLLRSSHCTVKSDKKA